jgi:hypothetical protein
MVRPDARQAERGGYPCAAHGSLTREVALANSRRATP